MGPANQVSPRQRIHAIDFAKGALVILMVVYHALNYLDYGSLPHEYLGFVPASFIMITGFLVAVVYAPRRDAGFEALASRLGVRALKLVAIFTVLNAAARVFWSKDRYGNDMSVSSFFENWLTVYFIGGAQGIAFDVLLPIAYTLLACILLCHEGVSRRPLRSVALALFVACTFLDLHGRSAYSINLISAGVIGAALGSFGAERIDKWGRSSRLLALAAIIYFGILVLQVDSYAAQILITMSWLLALYWLGVSLPGSPWWSQQICLLGRYSLLSYIVQILYLQATNILVLASPSASSWRALYLCVLIAVLTWATAAIAEFIRPRIKLVDQLYRLVFA